jgi:hypothetical protein
LIDYHPSSSRILAKWVRAVPSLAGWFAMA